MRSEANELGLRAYRRYAGKPGYYTNSSATHIKGKRGELGVEAWAISEALRVESLFRDKNKDSEADLVLDGVLTVDVKMWSEKHWEKLGRCVQADQAHALARKAMCIIWCTQNESGTKITLRGWSWTLDAFFARKEETGHDDMRRINNYQLEESDLRPMSELLVFARRLAVWLDERCAPSINSSP